MASLFDELTEKLGQDPSLMKRSGPRADLALLMFNARDDIRGLWIAAEAEVEAAANAGREPSGALAEAVGRLRPIFGERV